MVRLRNIQIVILLSGVNNMVKSVAYRVFIYSMSMMMFLGFYGCEDTNNNVENESIYVYINPRLPQDENGYYHLSINRSKWQTIHRFSGLVTDMNDNPIDVMKFKWESNLYWVLGDTLGKIIKRGLTDDMVYVSYDTLSIIGFEGHIVPTINPSSYSNSKGEFNQMGGFVQSMIGDTAEIRVSWFTDDYITFNVVLD